MQTVTAQELDALISEARAGYAHPPQDFLLVAHALRGFLEGNFSPADSNPDGSPPAGGGFERLQATAGAGDGTVGFLFGDDPFGGDPPPLSVGEVKAAGSSASGWDDPTRWVTAAPPADGYDELEALAGRVLEEFRRDEPEPAALTRAADSWLAVIVLALSLLADVLERCGGYEARNRPGVIARLRARRAVARAAGQAGVAVEGDRAARLADLLVRHGRRASRAAYGAAVDLAKE